MHIIDSSLLFELIKNTERGKKSIEKIGDVPVQFSALTVHEAMAGAEGRMEAILHTFFEHAEIISFEKEHAFESAKIHKELKKTGTTINFADILIAGQARQQGKTILCRDKDFTKIQELKCICTD